MTLPLGSRPHYQSFCIVVSHRQSGQPRYGFTRRRRDAIVSLSAANIMVLCRVRFSWPRNYGQECLQLSMGCRPSGERHCHGRDTSPETSSPSADQTQGVGRRVVEEVWKSCQTLEIVASSTTSAHFISCRSGSRMRSMIGAHIHSGISLGYLTMSPSKGLLCHGYRQITRLIHASPASHSIKFSTWNWRESSPAGGASGPRHRYKIPLPSPAYACKSCLI